MIIRIDRRFVDDSVRECFNSLRLKRDILVETGGEEKVSVEADYYISIEPVGNNLLLLSVDVLELEYRVPAGEIKDVLLRVLGLILGYQTVILQGFTVKNSNGNKTSPRIPVFVKSVVGFVAPDVLEYFRERDREMPNITEGILLPLVSMSPVVRSILERPLKFVSNDVEVTLTFHKGKMYMIPSRMEVIPTVLSTVSLANLDTFILMLEKHTFGFVDTFIKAYRQPSSDKVTEELILCLLDMCENHTDAEMECIRDVISAAPVFMNARDGVTERIRRFYVHNSKGTKRESDGYLVCRNVTHIDRRPIGSLKEYSEGM